MRGPFHRARMAVSNNAYAYTPARGGDGTDAWAIPRHVDRDDGGDDAAVSDADDPPAPARRGWSFAHPALVGRVRSRLPDCVGVGGDRGVGRWYRRKLDPHT